MVMGGGLRYERSMQQARIWGHSAALDQVRGYAAFLVFLAHYREFASPPRWATGIADVGLSIISRGWMGVSIFLVLSGFLFTMNYGGGAQKVEYWPFIRRRLFRILPLYLVILFLYNASMRPEWGPDDLLRFLLLQVNTGAEESGFGDENIQLGAIWTIAVEFQFYLIFPFLLAAVATSFWRTVPLLIVLSIVLRLFLVADREPLQAYDLLYHTMAGRIDQFLFGMCAARLMLQYGDRLRPWMGWLAVAGALVAFATHATWQTRSEYPLNILGFSIEGLIFSVFILGYYVVGGIGGWIGRLLVWFGMISYSFYLLNGLIGRKLEVWFGPQVQEMLFGSHWLMVFILCFIPSVLVATASYWAIERPFMRLASKTRPIAHVA
jgi:peptidoglycan/LPS O-acetylase OafA/YrhL